MKDPKEYPSEQFKKAADKPETVGLSISEEEMLKIIDEMGNAKDKTSRHIHISLKVFETAAKYGITLEELIEDLTYLGHRK